MPNGGGGGVGDALVGLTGAGTLWGRPKTKPVRILPEALTNLRDLAERLRGVSGQSEQAALDFADAIRRTQPGYQALVSQNIADLGTLRGGMLRYDPWAQAGGFLDQAFNRLGGLKTDLSQAATDYAKRVALGRGITSPTSRFGQYLTASRLGELAYPVASNIFASLPATISAADTATGRNQLAAINTMREALGQYELPVQRTLQPTFLNQTLAARDIGILMSLLQAAQANIAGWERRGSPLATYFQEGVAPAINLAASAVAGGALGGGLGAFGSGAGGAGGAGGGLSTLANLGSLGGGGGFGGADMGGILQVIGILKALGIGGGGGASKGPPTEYIGGWPVVG